MESNSNVQAPTILVIFGITGDLSQRKLIPALFDLYVKGFLPKIFYMVGFSRRGLQDKEFKEFVSSAINKNQHQHKGEDIEKFLGHISYVSGLFDNVKDYQVLAEKLIEVDKEVGVCSNKLFYLAVPPSMYENIFQNLADSGLTIPCGGEKGWTRVLVEKPFGRDLHSAQQLDKKLGLLFKEEQIFRIDHYLAKETVQNLLAFRFSNVLFEPIWSNKYIEKVEIKLWETLGIGTRGSFYEDVGALRDVGQNHMLQMLALVTMENPQVLEVSRIRKERAKVLKELQSINGNKLSQHIIRGQYEGYKTEKSVSPQSETETYFKIEAYIDNKRWEGVPFYLESGKKMKETKTEVTVYFKKTDSCLCPPQFEQHHQNILTFRVQPDEGISIIFWAKKPGFDMELEPKNLSFLYKDSENVSKLPDAYERILFDCIRGDQTLFTSTEEVAVAWQFITPILENWGKTKIYEYKKGSEGPEVNNK